MMVAPGADVTAEMDAADPGLTPDADAAAVTGSASCPNCGSLRIGSYCSVCGQKAAPLAPTVGYFLHELTHELLNVDGKIFRSLRLLLTRPGFLTHEIFAGRRASYLSPIRLYLIASILAFGLRAFFGVYDYADLGYTADPGEVADPAMVERAAEIERTMNRAVGVWLPRAMFVLVPLFAALVMLFRRRSGHTYPQHLYFALHLHAVWFFVSAAGVLLELLTLPVVPAVANVGLLLFFLWYAFVAFRRVYATTGWGTLWRTASIGCLYVTALIVVVLAIMAPTFVPFMFGLSAP
jgi:hypothetical protein